MKTETKLAGHAQANRLLWKAQDILRAIAHDDPENLRLADVRDLMPTMERLIRGINKYALSPDADVADGKPPTRAKKATRRPNYA